MSRLPTWIQNYRTLPRPVVLFACGQFMINLITATQFLLLNLFLKQEGFDDPTIAALGSNRFLAALVLALPAGLWLRGKPLKPVIIIGSILYPIATLASIEFSRLGMLNAATIGFLGTGVAILMINVASLPMILRLTPDDRSSEALSLLFATWAAASICGSVLSTALQAIGTIEIGSHTFLLNEHFTLVAVTIIAFSAPFLYARLPNSPPTPQSLKHWMHIPRNDIPVILRSIFPTVCIATGAGLSIQFLNLFFSNVHDVSARDYSAYSFFSNILVFFIGLSVPEIKRRLGWRGAILGVQTIAMLLLVLLGFTELMRTISWALPLAIFCFILRQPLMNMAAPSTSELIMRYVGEHNRELLSACNGAMWSGAWWIAARSFQILRANDFPYWQIFLMTAGLYLVGTISYLGLIRAVEKTDSNAEDNPSIPVSEPP